MELWRVSLGDHVQSVTPEGVLRFVEVFRWTHYDPSSWTEFVLLTTSTGHTLELSPGHMTHVGACCALDTLKLAANVVVGDVVYVVADADSNRVSSASIVAVSRVSRQGLFNVHTLEGNIVVSGVATTHFTNQTTWGPASRAYAPLWYRFVHGVNIVCRWGLGQGCLS